MITGHAEAAACALDAEGFSNRVSSRLQIPNALDGEEHRRFRALIDRFLEPPEVARLAPKFRVIAERLIRSLPAGSLTDAVWEIGAPLAVRFQCAWLGWHAETEGPLLEWMRGHRSALHAHDPARLAQAALDFEALVVEQLEQTCDEPGQSLTVTAQLSCAQVEDPTAPGDYRGLTQGEVVSILRNWTAGDLACIAACVGVVAHGVASIPRLQEELRARIDEPGALESAIDELLRIDSPFLWNRRVTTRDVQVKGRLIPAGSKVFLNWTAANRDPRRFATPDTFEPMVNAPYNLVYGIGSHVCPGRALATLQLREALAALLRSSKTIRLAERAPLRAAAPTGGYEHVWLKLG
jgi:cytochrome P450